MRGGTRGMGISTEEEFRGREELPDRFPDPSRGFGAGANAHTRVRMEGWQQKQLGVQRVAPRSAQERNLSTEKNGLTPTGLLMEGQCAHRGAIGLVFRVDCRQTKSWLIVNDKRVDRS
jgi:hypothetical protein